MARVDFENKNTPRAPNLLQTGLLFSYRKRKRGCCENFKLMHKLQKLCINYSLSAFYTGNFDED